MGMYDTFGSTQLKAGECVLAQYEIGDPVELSDGVYINDDAAVVVKDNIFMAELEHVYNHFGDELSKMKIDNTESLEL